MKKILIAALALVLVLVVLLAGVGLYALRRLNPDELRKTILAQARTTLGTELRVEKMDISLLSGVTLEGVAVQNPAPFKGDLLTAQAFVLRYRLLPLLRGSVEVERLSLEKPAIALAMDPRGSFNYEKLGGASAPKGGGSSASAAALPLRLVMKSLGVEDGTVVMNDAAKAQLLAVDDIDFRSAFEVSGGVAEGKGDVAIGSVNVADLLFVRRVSAPLTLSKEKVTLAPIRGDFGGGTLSGDVTVNLKGGFRYTTEFAVKGAKVEKLLAEAKSPAALTGTLTGNARFEGSGGLPTLRGKGSADIASCRAEGSRVLALLAGVLQVPELANPDFESCRVEFQQAGNRFATPVVRMVGDAVRLTGSGVMNIDTSGLDYTMTLALSPKLFAKITRPELRGAFTTRPDGFAAIDFKLFGTTLEPKTDLLSRVGKAAATEAAKQGLSRILKRKLF
jgi:uncharacterized protein involved in outer membrane biogenesis